MNKKVCSLEIDLLQRKKEVSLREIADYLEVHDVSVSQRTLERYIQNLCDDDVETVYSPNEKRIYTA